MWQCHRYQFPRWPDIVLQCSHFAPKLIVRVEQVIYGSYSRKLKVPCMHEFGRADVTLVPLSKVERSLSLVSEIFMEGQLPECDNKAIVAACFVLLQGAPKHWGAGPCSIRGQPARGKGKLRNCAHRQEGRT